jgi:putative protein kinase ArgK-like GTPase of G3E family
MELAKARQNMANDKLMLNRPREINPNPVDYAYPKRHYSEESQKESSSSSEGESYSKENIKKINNNLIDYINFTKKERKKEKHREKQREREMLEMDDKLEKVIEQNYYNNEELKELRLKILCHSFFHKILHLQIY